MKIGVASGSASLLAVVASDRGVNMGGVLESTGANGTAALFAIVRAVKTGASSLAADSADLLTASAGTAGILAALGAGTLRSSLGFVGVVASAATLGGSLGGAVGGAVGKADTASADATDEASANGDRMASAALDAAGEDIIPAEGGVVDDPLGVPRACARS